MLQESQKSSRPVTKSRNRIQDAFLALTVEKSFKYITVKDISERAQVNRATFYANFKDKYDLLDSFISDKFMTIMASRINSNAKLTEDTLHDLIFIMCDYHKTVSSNYAKLYKSAGVLIDMKIQLKLQCIVLKMLNNTVTPSEDEYDKLELVTVVISSGLYCSTKRWHSKDILKYSSKSSALIKDLLSFMISGLTTVFN